MVEVEIGKMYVCQPVGVKKAVIGIIEQLYDNTALVRVPDCQMEDQPVVQASNQRMLVKFDKIKAMAA